MKSMEKMSCFGFLFLACFVSVTIAQNEILEIPTSVNSLYAECVLEGYLGPCSKMMFFDGKFDCKQVTCAAPLRNNSRTHRAVDIGGALNGTHCGPHHVCMDEVCIELPENAKLPEEIEKSERQFECHRADPDEFEEDDLDLVAIE